MGTGQPWSTAGKVMSDTCPVQGRHKHPGGVPGPEGVQANGQVLVKQNGQVGPLRLHLPPVNPAAHGGIPAQIRGVDVQDPFKHRRKEKGKNTAETLVFHTRNFQLLPNS